jgi:hypothetical protein
MILFEILKLNYDENAFPLYIMTSVVKLTPTFMLAQTDLGFDQVHHGLYGYKDKPILYLNQGCPIISDPCHDLVL